MLQFSLSAQWIDNGSNITTTDKVGIGTSSPAHLLHLKSTLPYMRFEMDTNSYSYLEWYELSTRFAAIGWSGHQNPKRIGFFTNDGTSFSERISMLDNGNFGIGTTNPSSKLHVISETLGQTADSKTILTTIEGNVLTNNSKFQILNKRNANGTNWLETSLRLQRVIDNTPQAFIDFGIDGDIGSYGLGFGTRNGFSGSQTTRMVIKNNGYVGIGTSNPDAKLAVNGNIHTKEVKVDLVGWPDFVFEKEYHLPTLKEVESYIKEKGHLQNIPSAEEVEANGVKLGEMNSKLLQKIEELMLYTIQQQKEIESLKEQNIQFRNELETLKEK